MRLVRLVPVRRVAAACRAWWWLCVASGLATAACGGSNPTGPSAVAAIPYGQTTFAVVVNPVVNSINSAAVPQPGSVLGDVRVSTDGGPTASTDDTGVAVIGPVAAGQATLALSGGGQSGRVAVGIAAQELRELAVALSSTGAAMMANVPYEFGGRVVEVSAIMPIAQVNAALADSNLIVFFRSGTYTGDLVVAGSRVTLYGEGPRGGNVALNGNVMVRGSTSRIRGARITGTLDVPASGFGMSFSRVSGAVNVSGSGAVLLNNAFCSSVSVAGSGATALGNAGAAPVPRPRDC